MFSYSHRQSTFSSAMQAARGIKGQIYCSSTPTEAIALRGQLPSFAIGNTFALKIQRFCLPKQRRVCAEKNLQRYCDQTTSEA